MFLLFALLGCPKTGPLDLGSSTGVATAAVALPDAPAPPKPTMDEEYGTVAVNYMRADAPGALAAIDVFERDYPTSPYLEILQDWRTSLAFFGKPAPALQITRWVDQPATLADHPVTLVIFFEPWCPHCQQEVPGFQPLQEMYEARGLGVMAVTALTRGSTDEMLQQFVELGGLKFPVGVEDGSMSEAWGVTGVPHAAFVREGTVVWTGNASLITLDLVDAIVDRQPLPLPMPEPAAK